MNTKKMIGVITVAAAAATALYLVRRYRGKLDVQGLKNGVRKATHHLTDVFHNAKEASHQKMAGA